LTITTRPTLTGKLYNINCINSSLLLLLLLLPSNFYSACVVYKEASTDEAPNFNQMHIQMTSPLR